MNPFVEIPALSGLRFAGMVLILSLPNTLSGGNLETSETGHRYRLLNDRLALIEHTANDAHYPTCSEIRG